jgi:hypothetical protein
MEWLTKGEVWSNWPLSKRAPQPHTSSMDSLASHWMHNPQACSFINFTNGYSQCKWEYGKLLCTATSYRCSFLAACPTISIASWLLGTTLIHTDSLALMLDPTCCWAIVLFYGSCNQAKSLLRTKACYQQWPLQQVSLCLQKFILSMHS